MSASNTSPPEYRLVCLCTDGKANLAAPFTILISSACAVSDLLKAVVGEASGYGAIQIPSNYKDHVTLWKPKQPLAAAADLKKSSVFQSIANKFHSSPSIIQQLRLDSDSEQFPKSAARSATHSQAPVANLQELRRFTSQIFIR